MLGRHEPNHDTKTTDARTTSPSPLRADKNERRDEVRGSNGTSSETSEYCKDYRRSNHIRSPSSAAGERSRDCNRGRGNSCSSPPSPCQQTRSNAGASIGDRPELPRNGISGDLTAASYHQSPPTPRTPVKFPKFSPGALSRLNKRPSPHDGDGNPHGVVIRRCKDGPQFLPRRGADRQHGGNCTAGYSGNRGDGNGGSSRNRGVTNNLPLMSEIPSAFFHGDSVDPDAITLTEESILSSQSTTGGLDFTLCVAQRRSEYNHHHYTTSLASSSRSSTTINSSPPTIHETRPKTNPEINPAESLGNLSSPIDSQSGILNSDCGESEHPLRIVSPGRPIIVRGLDGRVGFWAISTQGLPMLICTPTVASEESGEIRGEACKRRDRRC